LPVKQIRFAARGPYHPTSPDPDDLELLDAYSRAVIGVV
jgi:hypothetical protein